MRNQEMLTSHTYMHVYACLFGCVGLVGRLVGGSVGRLYCGFDTIERSCEMLWGSLMNSHVMHVCQMTFAFRSFLFRYCKLLKELFAESV